MENLSQFLRTILHNAFCTTLEHLSLNLVERFFYSNQRTKLFIEKWIEEYKMLIEKYAKFKMAFARFTLSISHFEFWIFLVAAHYNDYRLVSVGFTSIWRHK